jgi:hypothetical protein
VTYTIQETVGGWWVVEVPVTGRALRLALYPSKDRAEADIKERIQDAKRRKPKGAA